MPKDLLSLRDISTDRILKLISEAQSFRDGAFFPDLSGKVACNLFFESSTRTQYSFNVAEEKLGMRVVSFDPQLSSLNKNESFYDTIKTFDSFGIDALVIRHTENEYYKHLVGKINASILNGGDGTGNHPTQSLLDLMTIKQEFGGFEGLKIAIIGDIRFSRVAHTNIEVMRRLGMNVVVSGPPEFMDEDCTAYEPFEKAISTSDIVMMLRIQFERHKIDGAFSAAEYNNKYGINKGNINKLKSSAIVMHPAPVNRGIELSDEIIECDKSRIFKQIENGVFIRMAALADCLQR